MNMIPSAHDIDRMLRNNFYANELKKPKKRKEKNKQLKQHDVGDTEHESHDI